MLADTSIVLELTPLPMECEWPWDDKPVNGVRNKLPKMCGGSNKFIILSFHNFIICKASEFIILSFYHLQMVNVYDEKLKRLKNLRSDNKHWDC